MKKALIIAFFILFCFVVYKQGYDIKITIKSPYMSAIDTDLKIAKEIKDKLAQIEQIKTLVIFSYPNYCNIYLKFHLLSNKNRALYKIQNYLLNYDYKIDFDYKTPYSDLLIIKSDDYKELKKLTDNALSELLNLNITKNILNLGERENSIYISFNSDILSQYDLSLEDIKNAIKEQNIEQKRITKINNNSYQIISNSSVKSSDDVNNMLIYSKNKNFSHKFEDIFDIEEKEREPLEYYINYDNQKAQVLAIKKRDFYPNFIYKIKLIGLKNKLNSIYGAHFELKNLSKSAKTQIYLDDNCSILKTKEIAQNIAKKLKERNISDNIIFIGINSPKKAYGEDFFELEKNKITILNKNKKEVEKIGHESGLKILKGKRIKYYDDDLDNLYKKAENKPSLLKKSYQIDYNFDNYNLNDYFSNKNEVLNYLEAKNQGIVVSNFYEDYIDTPIILKNEDDDIFIYSKKFKNLISISSLVKPNVIKGFDTIIRKNKFYYNETYDY